MQLLKQSTAATLIVGPVLDSTGAAYTGMVIGDFNITKNGTTAAMAAAATATHDHNGMYLLVLTTGNTDTAGRLAISCNKATYAMPIYRAAVLVATVFDALITNATTAAGGLGDIQRVAGTVQTAGDLAGLLATIAAYIDTEVAAIKAKTDNLPSDPADASDVAGAFSTVNSTLATIAAYIDTEVAAIKAKTDNLPSDPADASDIAASFSSLASTLATIAAYIDTEVAAIKAKTDNLPASPANETTLAGLVTTVGAAGAGLSAIPKTGFKLASDGLDSITATAPAGVATTFPQMIVQTWRRFFKKAVHDKDAGEIKTYGDNGTSVLTTQTATEVANVETQGAAS